MSLAVPTSSEFPTLAREGLVYLDTAATSQTVRPALEAMDRYYETYRASIHRGIYAIATEATDAYELARERVARFTNSTVGETVFTKNATEAINLVAYSWGRANVGPDDLVVLSQMEHHANIVPWQLLGCRLAYIPMDDDGVLDLDAFDALLEQGPKLVAVAHVSNVVGTINPVAEITRAPTRRAPWSWSTAPRPCRRCRSTSPSSTPTSTSGPGTRPTGRPASACCTAGARSWRRCRRSWAAGT